jgi:alpha-L-rhamnosidase
MPALLLVFSLFRSLADGASVSEQRCEYLENPVGIDVEQPRLSWMMTGSGRGQAQSAYQVLVASNEGWLKADWGDLWDTGKVVSDQSTHLRYAGKALSSNGECFWKVRIWDQDGKPSPWSPVAHWSMGLLMAGDWNAKWIGFEQDQKNPDDRRLPARWLRKEFSVEKKVKRAIVYCSGLGLSELYLNGEKVGNNVLSPGLTEYPKRVFYVAFDITKQLRKGQNAFGVVLGNGRFYAPREKRTTSYGFPKLLLHLRVEYTDDSVGQVVSDESWKVSADGPILANNEYDGEEYDARKEFNGWNSPGFNDSAWQPAQLVIGPEGRLSSQMMAPIRVTQILKPNVVSEPKPGVFIFDMGQNMVGWCRLKVSGPAGTRVSLRHAETLEPDGTLYLANLRTAKATDVYTLKGGGTELWEPRFTYHGFRYVEVTGFPGTPRLSTIEGHVVHDDMNATGEFVCSNPLLDRIYTNITWGVRGNYRSMPTDCPQRDERQGWLGDRGEESQGEMYFFDNAAFYENCLQDIADVQKDSGSVSDVAPAYWPLYNDNVTWPSTGILLPAALYLQFGDSSVIGQHYDSARAWLDYMLTFLKDGIISKDSYGDWCVPPEDPKLIHSKDPTRKTSETLLATAYLFHDLQLMEQYATMLGKTNDACRFQGLAAQVKTAFNDKFLNRELGQYDNGTQTSCVLPLAFGLVPDDMCARIFEHLVHKLTIETKGHIGTGLVGGMYLCRVLSDHGRPDLAYSMATQTDYPGWGYMVGKGATTIWELWNGDTADPSMNSGNHVMLIGDLTIWLYQYLAGIRPDPEKPGYKHIILKPELVGDLSSARGTHRSPYGLIVSDWRKTGTGLDWRVTIPPNTASTIYMPTKSATRVFEGGKPVATSPCVKFVRQENDRAVFQVGSGDYHFEVR